MSSKLPKREIADRIAPDGSVASAKLSKKELADRIQALCVLVVASLVATDRIVAY